MCMGCGFHMCMGCGIVKHYMLVAGDSTDMYTLKIHHRGEIREEDNIVT